MPEIKAEKQGAKQERTAWILRARLGKASRKSIAHDQARVHIGKKIVEALGKSPQTVPEIAAATGLPSHQVLWCLMAMKKYGKLAEGRQRGDYYEYALSAKQEKTK